MSQWKRCKRLDFIRRLRKLGFDGPYSGTRHQFMIYQKHRLAIPTNSEYSVSQLQMMLHEVKQIINRGISAEDWVNLRQVERPKDP